MTLEKPLKKPSLRGYFHQEAFFMGLGACIFLVARSRTETIFFSNLIYSFGLLFLFGVSAIYHRPHWEPKPRALMKRLDHSAIFILIAGTFTPFCLLALPPSDGKHLLIFIWSVAIAGVMQSIFWVKAPKWFTAILYVGMGWLIFPYLKQINEALGETNVGLLLAGGIIYTIGAVFYALKKPRLFPKVFGYHELFHVFTIIAATLHFIVIYQLSNRVS
jgi:hemolysin III